MLLRMLQQRSGIETARIEIARGVVGHADQLDAMLRQRLHRIAADIAEPLHDRGGTRRRQTDALQRAPDQIGDAAAGRFTPALGAAGGDRLAGDDLGHRPALIHGIRVHEPRHDLLVGAHVGRHHVGVRTDERDHLLHVAARQALQFVARQRARIDGDAALRAAIRQAGERAFPAHPDRQRRHLADIDAEREARAALGRPERQMVLHAIPLIDRDASVIAVDRTGHGDGALRIEQPVAFVERDFQMVGDHLELLPGHVEHRARIDRHQPSPSWTSACMAAVGRE